jgi:hypothetical protein
MYFKAAEKRITGFRVTQMRSAFSPTLPILEWQENDDSNVRAFFKFRQYDVPCSWLLYYEVDEIDTRWPRKFIQWNVTDPSHFKDLFHAAQSTIGMPHWSKIDIIRFMLEVCSETGESDRYIVLMDGLMILEN